MANLRVKDKIMTGLEKTNKQTNKQKTLETP